MDCVEKKQEPIKLNNLLKYPNLLQNFVIKLSDCSSSGSEEEEEILNVLDVQVADEQKNEQLDQNLIITNYQPPTKSTPDRKKQVNNLKIRLQETDQHFNRLKRLINRKNLNVQQIKAKIVQNSLKLRKQQAQVRKMYLSYLNATKEMKDNLKEIASLNESLSVLQKGVDGDKKLMTVLENKSKNLEKVIETNLKELKDEELNFDESAIQIIDQVGCNKTIIDLEGDNMSLASSDEQCADLILEHNDTSANRRESLFVQQSTNKQTNESTDQTLDKPANQLNTVQPSTQQTDQTILDDTRISKMIDLKLDHTRKSTTASKSPIKYIGRQKENIKVLGIQSNLIKKKPVNKKKNALLKKMLMIEERNQKEEAERVKKEEQNKLKLMHEKKEKDINDLRKMLKSKQILSNAIIGLKREIRNSLKSNDKFENYDLFMSGLPLFLENTLDKSYLFDDLTIQIDNKLFDKNLDSSMTSSASNCERSNEITQSISTNQDKETNLNQNISNVLESIRAYRLSNNFEEKYIKKNGQDFTMIVDSFFANKVDPYSITCNFDLNGKCNDDQCNSQHKQNFLLDQRQKVIDLLLYNPSITRYKGEVKTKEDMNKLLKHLNEFIDNLEKKYTYNEMIKYLVRLIRISDDDESIIVKTKVEMQQSENTIINEYISQQQANQTENTFADYRYNFKIRDRKNVITYSNLRDSTKFEHQFVVEEDFENNYQERFFKFNGVGTNLEEYCKENPTDIKNWIKLIWTQINSIHCKRSEKKQQLQNALKVVMRALDLNRCSIDLWKTYLYLLINLLDTEKTDESFDRIEKQLQFICKKIIEQYPSFEIWKFYLSLNLNYLNKELISSEIIDEIQSNNITFYNANNERNEKLISNAYLEMLLYKVNLYIEINKIDKAKAYLERVLSSSTIEPVNISKMNDFIKNFFTAEDNAEDRKKYQETALLTNEDKVFLWLNYLHLVHFHKLPNQKYELFKQGFSGLIEKKPFLITFGSIKKSSLDKLLGIFLEAIKDCFFNIESNLMDYHQQAQQQIKQQIKQQNLITCLPLLHNLANFYIGCGKRKAAINVFNMVSTEENQILVPLLINKAIFEDKHNYANECLYTLGDTQVYKQDHFDIIYHLCLFHFKNGEYKYFNFEASKILVLFFDFDRSVSISISFKKLLYRKLELDNERTRLLEKLDSKLWILYLMSEILSSSEDNMESFLYNSISLSKVNKHIKTHTISLLHFLYLNFCAKTVNDQEKLDQFLEKIKYACQLIEDQQFQFYLLKHFSNCFFSTQQRFKFFLKFLIIIPQNKYILNYFLNLAFNEMNSKKICYQVLNYFVERKNLRNLLEPVHWFLAIYLAIDLKEHLNVHHFFQMAISNYPYNKQLFHYLLAYEVSLNHSDHCNVIRSILKQLKIPDIEKSLSFD